MTEDDNTWLEANGNRHCVTCNRDRQRALRAARKELANV